MQADNLIYTPTSNQTEYRSMLVIGIEFNNFTFHSDISLWENKIFGTGSGELNDYYNEVSEGQFQFKPVNNGSVSNGMTIIKLSQDHPNFDTGSNWQKDIETRLYPLLSKALNKVDDNGFDFKRYDTNSDGKITPNELLITFILSGEEDAYSGGIYTSGIWAHEDCTTNSYTHDGVQLLGCTSGGNYSVLGERDYDSATNFHDATIGIIAHELGHASFGLPDLYDTLGSSKGIGYYGLMSQGSWGQATANGEAGDTPIHMCAWSKIDVGWYSNSASSNDASELKSIDATASGRYNIIKTVLNSSSNEYFLIENRNKDGYDAGLNYLNNRYTDYQGGLAIWHIDESVIQAKRSSNTINGDVRHKGVDLEEAAGNSVDYKDDPKRNLYYGGNVDAFTPYTLPNTDLYTNVASMLSITNISTPGATMSLQIDNPK